MRRRDISRSLERDANAVVDCHTHVGIDESAPLCRRFPYCLSVEDLTIRMNALGVTHAVAFPISSSFYDSRAALSGVVRRDRRSPCRSPYELENANLLYEIYEVFPACAERVLPFAMFDPSRKVREQVAHLEFLLPRYPLFGLKALTTYTQSHVRDLLRRGRRILEFARDHDLPVLLHTSVHPDDPWADVFDALEVVRAFPDVRFCLAHACRFSRKALDGAGDLPNCFVDLSAFHIHCRLAEANDAVVATRSDRFPAPYDNPLAAMKAVASAYPDTIVWGSDTPFHYFVGQFPAVTNLGDEKGKAHTLNLPCAWDAAAKCLFRLPAALRRRIARENTLRFLFG